MLEAVSLTGLHLGFGTGAARVDALRGVSVAFKRGQMTLITGPSGGGKTTLLSVLGALVRADAGRVVIAGEDLSRLGPNALAAFRRTQVGFIFQAFRLIRSLTAAENVALSLHLRSGGDRTGLLRQAIRALSAVGLADKAALRPDALSGGEKQRVAVARALAHAPPLVLADEPTASLDAANGMHIMALLRDVARAPDRTVVIVSHDDRAKPFADRIVRMEDGRILGEDH